MMWIKLILGWCGAYLLGSIPSGIAWSWLAKRIDVREHGSGRTGGTNVWRSAGFWPAFATAISDILKGVAAIWLARGLGLTGWWLALAGTLAVVGHNHSIFLGFRGGAGTGTSAGVAIALWWPSLLILVITAVIIGLLTGHASTASITVAIMLPVILGLHGELPNALAFGLLTMVLTLWALRPNIERLIKREERFLPIYAEKAPPICISRHPSRKLSQE